MKLKLFVLFFFILSATIVSAQLVTQSAGGGPGVISEVQGWIKGKNGSIIAVKDTLNNPATSKVGALTIRPQDTIGHLPFTPVYMSNGIYWSKISSSIFIIPVGVDSVTLYNGLLCEHRAGVQTCWFLTPGTGGSVDSFHLNFDSTWILHFRNGTQLGDSIYLFHTYLYVDQHFSLTPYLTPVGQLLNATRLVDSVYDSPFGTGYRYYKYATGHIDSLPAGSGSGSVLDTAFDYLVRDSLSSPPVLPLNGSIFLVGTSPTGAFVPHTNEIALYDSLANTYSFTVADTGNLLLNAATGFVSQLIGSTWVRLGLAVLHQFGENVSYGNIVAGSKANFDLRFITNNVVHNWISNTGIMSVDSTIIWKGASPGYNIASIAFGEKTLISNTTGFENVALGDSSMIKNTTGPRNTAIGKDALQQNTIGSANTMVGWIAGQQNTTGDANTAIGMQALAQNTVGTENTAAGHQAMFFASGNYNSAFGAGAMLSAGSGSYNTGAGAEALRNNQANNNTAFGYRSQYTYTTGNENTSIGYLSLFNNASGILNVAIGSNALYTNNTGLSNVAVGTYAMLYNQTGGFNTAIGYHALYNNVAGSNNVVAGQEAGAYKDGSTGGASFNLDRIDNSILIGKRSSPGGDSLVHVIVIGDSAVGPAISHTITIGNNTNVGTYLGGYGTVTPITGVAVYNLAVDANHKIIEVAAAGGASFGNIQQTLNTGNTFNRNDSLQLAGNTFTITGGNVGFGAAPTEMFQITDPLTSVTHFQISKTSFNAYMYSTDYTADGIIATVSDLVNNNVRTYINSNSGTHIPEVSVYGIENNIKFTTNGADNTGSIYISDSSLATASNNNVWTLLDATTGRGAWQSLSGYVDTGSAVKFNTSGISNGDLPIWNTANSRYDYFTPNNYALLNGNNVFTANGAASTANLAITGSVFTGGSSTTTFPMLLVSPAGATIGGLSTNGVISYFNGPSGFAGDLVTWRVNGAARASITSTGSMILSTGNLTVSTGSITVTGSTVSSTANLLTGTAGAGYIQIPNQSSAPSTPTTSGRLYFDNSNRFSWKGTNGFVRTFDGTSNTADRIYVLPDAAGTVALTSDLSAYAPLASPTFTGTVTIPTPFTLGATSVTTTGTKLNYLTSATGTTGTTSTNIVFSTSPTLVTPILGVASATTINKVTITAPATGSTLTIADGKALTVNSSMVMIDSPEHVYAGTPSFTAGTNPTTLTGSYQWTQVGKLVSLRINLLYATPGVTVTIANAIIPADCPVPALPTGYATNDYTYAAYGYAGPTSGAGIPIATRCFLKMNASPTIVWIFASGALTNFFATIQYYTN